MSKIIQLEWVPKYFSEEDVRIVNEFLRDYRITEEDIKSLEYAIYKVVEDIYSKTTCDEYPYVYESLDEGDYIYTDETVQRTFDELLKEKTGYTIEEFERLYYDLDSEEELIEHIKKKDPKLVKYISYLLDRYIPDIIIRYIWEKSDDIEGLIEYYHEQYIEYCLGGDDGDPIWWDWGR